MCIAQQAKRTHFARHAGTFIAAKARIKENHRKATPATSRSLKKPSCGTSSSGTPKVPRLETTAAPRTWSQESTSGPDLAAPGGDWLRFLRPQADLSRAALEGYQRSMRDLEAFVNQQSATRLALGSHAAVGGRNGVTFPPLFGGADATNQQALFQQRALNNTLSLQQLLRRLFPTPQPPAVGPPQRFAPIFARRRQQ
ncbi:uncharacterized protein [Dermacentor albipictus]|uniref:uncharacterized protein n=1 Tax=Dermacentor albipictus TaxID=60249 RepID=UPI0038FD1EDF